jgi:hypothetical protein
MLQTAQLDRKLKVDSDYFYSLPIGNYPTSLKISFDLIKSSLIGGFLKWGKY